MYDEWGIARGYHEVNGTWHETPRETVRFLRASIGEPGGDEPMWFVEHGSSHWLQSRCHLTLEDGTDMGDHDGLPGDLPIGYHRLTPLDGGAVTTLVIAPTTCRDAPYGWGVAAQVYSLWREDGWGIGDLRDVERLGRHVAERGGCAVLLSPLHAPAPALLQEASPYYPSSRRWLNPLMIPLDGPSPVDNEAGGLIDRSRVWPAKRHALHERFARVETDLDWRAWADAQGPDLWLFCTWNALCERYGPSWRYWPAELRHPDHPNLRRLAEHDESFARDRDFHAWLQWIALRTLRHATASADVSFIGDLAVGCSPDGADAWSLQDLMALDVHIGAPPDPFNFAGQDWGLPPFVPERLRSVGYRPFIAMVRSACTAMDGLRIDHVMGLFRQFWIPEGGSPADGAYVRLRAHELVAIIRLESARAGTFVIGEDLGTVEPMVRDELRRSSILGTKVWWFDPRPGEWANPNLATVTTHDLPTVMGVWQGTDGSPAMAAELQAAVHRHRDATAASVELHRQVAASRAQLCLASLDDLAGSPDRPNHPGTLDHEHPNWCRRLDATTEAILHREPGSQITSMLADVRPHG